MTLLGGEGLFPSPVRDRIYTQIGAGGDSIDHESQVETGTLREVVARVIRCRKSVEVHMGRDPVPYADARVVVWRDAVVRSINALG